MGGAEDRVISRQVRIDRMGDTEIHHLDLAVAQNHDVLRLDVTVDDVMHMGIGERTAHLRGNLRGTAAGNRAVRLDGGLQIGPLQILHDDIQDTVRIAELMHVDDIW